ncbi:phosphoribosyl 1,2-cyclic phosphate phosphodiesterase [Bradyrhizobium sp. LM4.3]
MTLTLTILGCGSSAGVPRPALGWGACDPNNPKNRRRRCSLLVEQTSGDGTTRIVIDTSPDLREQLLSTNVDHIDAVFLTHEHADQTHGMDDLRSVVMHMRRRIPTYLNQTTANDIMSRFSYCFVSPAGSDYPPILTAHSIEAGESQIILGKGGAVTMTAFLVQHGHIPALGYRIGDAAYTPDLNDIPARELGRTGKSGPLDRRRPALHQPCQPFQHQRRVVLDRPLQAEARRHYQHDRRRRLRSDPAVAARGCGAGL